jgi:hypothetical protein
MIANLFPGLNHALSLKSQFLAPLRIELTQEKRNVIKLVDRKLFPWDYWKCFRGYC